MKIPLVLLLALTFAFFCRKLEPQEKSARPSSVHKNATFVKDLGLWVHDSKTKQLAIRKTWNTAGKLISLISQYKNRRAVRQYYSSGNIFSVRQEIFIKSQNPDQIDRWAGHGKQHLYFRSGSLSSVSCLNEANGNIFNYCRKSKYYTPRGSIKKTISHKRKCTQGCGEFKPFMPPGRYYVTASSLRVREKPSVKAKVLFTLKRNEFVQVTADTRKIETHSFETAPWVKIKAKDGRVGYAFGGFLYKEGEKYVDMSD